jgi:hypothetical protein
MEITLLAARMRLFPLLQSHFHKMRIKFILEMLLYNSVDSSRSNYL